jgi:hypothetical protein
MAIGKGFLSVSGSKKGSVWGTAVLVDTSYGLEDPTRRQLFELAQREGVTIEPQIDVEDVETAIELAARGYGDVLIARGILLSLGRRVPKKLGWVPFADPIYDTFAFVNRSLAARASVGRTEITAPRRCVADGVTSVTSLRASAQWTM